MPPMARVNENPGQSPAGVIALGPGAVVSQRYPPFVDSKIEVPG
uniref:Uncharacterized protein n=1 Tax=Arundo donax TaxID=35708 RepID=A0A0A8YSL4_ARUDO